MASTKTMLQLQERVRLSRTAWKLADLAVLFLLLALLARRASSLVAAGCAAPACTWCWVAALICEAWFTVVWLININAKWNPVRFDTHPERLAQRYAKWWLVSSYTRLPGKRTLVRRINHST